MFVGYHIHPGGHWSGDYLVADYFPFKRDCDVVKSKVQHPSHKQVLNNHTGKFALPSQNDEKERVLKEEDYNAPDEPPDQVDTSDDEATGPDSEAGELFSKRGHSH